MDALIPADQNREMFSVIAERYDRMNRIMSFGLDVYWRKEAVKALKPVGGGRYLDIGCGTADLCIETLRVCPDAHITGIDPVATMLEIGADKIEKASLTSSATLVSGDALHLQFADGEFNGVVSGFCIRNITDRKQAFAEIYRTLSDSGKLVILELGVPENGALRAMHRIHGRCMVPLAARLAGFKGAYRYLIDSINQFAEPQLLIEELAGAGFSEVSHRPLSGGIVNLFSGEKRADPL